MKAKRIMSATERKAMKSEIKRQLAEFNQKNEAEISAMILWILHTEFGFGEKRLKRFYDTFSKSLDELSEHYELGEDDQAWLCLFKLKEIGIDLEKWID